VTLPPAPPVTACRVRLSISAEEDSGAAIDAIVTLTVHSEKRVVGNLLRGVAMHTQAIGQVLAATRDTSDFGGMTSVESTAPFPPVGRALAAARLIGRGRGRREGRKNAAEQPGPVPQGIHRLDDLIVALRCDVE
jgi:hypothetical protein